MALSVNFNTQTRYALLDCHNFYASCEKVFRPDLGDKPLVVLSNNDGCIIARSAQAKALGIPMGVPYFKIKNLLEQEGVHIFSSNFALYGDISRRVMQIVAKQFSEIEIYSIDEVFIDLSSEPEWDKHEKKLQELVAQIEQQTSIAVGIGVGPTKVLAKLANRTLKHFSTPQEVYFLDPHLHSTQQLLKKTDVESVWGVGRSWSRQLKECALFTAWDLAQADHVALRKKFGVVLTRISLELCGLSCLTLEQEEHIHHSFRSIRSFGKKITDRDTLRAVLYTHMSKLAQKMRRNNLESKMITIYIASSKHALNPYSASFSVPIPATNNTLSLSEPLSGLLKKIYKSGYEYVRAGVTLSSLQKTSFKQQSFELNERTCAQKEKLMKVLDSVNLKFGKNTLKISNTLCRENWEMKSQRRSKRYTTSWEELCWVK